MSWGLKLLSLGALVSSFWQLFGFHQYFLRLSGHYFDFHPKPLPVVQDSSLLANIDGCCFAVGDLDSGTILLGKNIFVPRHPASLVKLANGILAAEIYLPNEILTAWHYPVGKNLGLQAGEFFWRDDLLGLMLVASANDAAYSLANNYPLFVSALNQRFRSILSETYFLNPDGEDEEQQVSTVFDLIHLARLATKQPWLTAWMRKEQIVVKTKNSGRRYVAVATNQLLGRVKANIGLKTGWTPKAGGCFIGVWQVGHHRILTVVLGSKKRFTDSLVLFSWAKRKVSWLNLF